MSTNGVSATFLGLGTIEIVLYVSTLMILGVALAVIFYFWRLIKYSEITKGDITKILRRAGQIYVWKVLTNVTLSDAKGAAKVDQITVGPFGVLLTVCLHERANYYGEMTGEHWTATGNETEGRRSFRKQLPNPAKTCQEAEEILRRKLIEARITGVQVYTLVVRTQQKVVLFVQGSQEKCLDQGQLRAALKTGRFQKDRGTDLEKILKVIQPQ